jgi:hypothetical protein
VEGVAAAEEEVAKVEEVVEMVAASLEVGRGGGIRAAAVGGMAVNRVDGSEGGRAGGGRREEEVHRDLVD